MPKRYEMCVDCGDNLAFSGPYCTKCNIEVGHRLRRKKTMKTKRSSDGIKRPHWYS